MSDTPRTDAAINADGLRGSVDALVVFQRTMALARALERENAELRRDAMRWRKFLKNEEGLDIAPSEWTEFVDDLPDIPASEGEGLK